MKYKYELKTVLAGTAIIVGCVLMLIAMSGCDPNKNNNPPEMNDYNGNNHTIVFQFRVYDHGNTLADIAKVTLTVLYKTVDGGEWSNTLSVGAVYDYPVTFSAGDNPKVEITGKLVGKPGNIIECRVMEGSAMLNSSTGYIKKDDTYTYTTCTYS